MGLSCGMIGLANVGKTTLFNALVGGQALAANYPFSTVETNVGIAALPDPRLDTLSDKFQSKKITFSTLEVRDLAGLVQGASQGEGLGNQFLAQIREVDALFHVVRCFEAPDVVHIGGGVNPTRDIEIIETELFLADVETLERRKQRVDKRIKSGDPKAGQELKAVDNLIERLNKGEWLRGQSLTEEEQTIMLECQLLSSKPLLFIANASEGVGCEDPMVQEVERQAEQRRVPVIILSGQLEAELAVLPEQERGSYLLELGLQELGLVRLARAAYDLLSLITFFTAGQEEARAWPLRKGTGAQAAAGKIHSDMARGFIRAEVYTYADLLNYGSVQGVREKGLFRLEGREYIIQEGDIVFFRFNV